MLAVGQGHAGIVEILLADGRVNPAQQHNLAILIPASSGFKEIAEMLFRDERIEADADIRKAFRIAAESGRLGIVNLSWKMAVLILECGTTLPFKDLVDLAISKSSNDCCMTLVLIHLR